MGDLTTISTIPISFIGFTINIKFMFIMTWLVMAILILFGFFVTRKLKEVPGSGQNILELIFGFIEEITVSTLGKNDGKKLVPFIFMIFSFTLLSNLIGIFPNIAHLFGIIIALFHKIFGNENIKFVYEGIFHFKLIPDLSTWYSFLFKVPGFEEPTRSINTDLAMGLMVFFVVHTYSIRKKGIIEYLKQYWGDIIPCHGWWLLLFPINVFIPLNIISEISSVISHSFRLFGNIFGGFMIVTIVSYLIKYLIIPIPLLAFFGLFAGLVQAFVFTMLAITYIGQKA